MSTTNIEGHLFWPRRSQEPLRTGGTPDTSPTLTLGRDRMPTRCCHCGSPALGRDEPYGDQKLGEIVCLICSRRQCWLRGAK